MSKKVIAAYREYCSECRDERRRPVNIFEWLGRIVYSQLSEAGEIHNPIF